jgi:peptide/nickel transport system substrate-binding protein
MKIKEAGKMKLRRFFISLFLVPLFSFPLVQAIAENYEPVEITLYTPTRAYVPARAEAGKMAADMWRKLGIRVKVVEREFSALVQEQTLNRDYESHLMFWTARPDRLDPQLYLETYTSKDRMNAGVYKHPEYDKIVQQARIATDKSIRQSLVYEAQEKLARDAAALFLFHSHSLTCYNHTRFKNLKPQVGDNPFWNVWNLTLAEPQGSYAYIRATTRNPYTLNQMGTRHSADVETQKISYDRLIRIGLDGAVQPWAATAWEWTDNKTLQMSLRKGMKWHDGKEVTAKDVKFTIEYLQQWGHPYLEVYFRTIKSVDAPDDLTVIFHLEAPNAAFVIQSLGQLFIMPEHIWNGVVKQKGLAHPSEWIEKESWIGSGPFKVMYYDREDKIVYKRFKDHFIADDIGFDTLVYKIYGNMDVALGAVESGEATFADTLQAAQFERAQKNQALTTVSAPCHGYTVIYLHNERSPFDDKAMRIAVSYATDKKKILEAALHRHGDIAWSPIAPGNKFWYNPTATKYKFNLEKAKVVLKNAGYTWNDSGQLMRPVKK